MGANLATTPLVCVFRAVDGSTYLFMEMARVDPGHYVGWGKLREMDRKEAQAEAFGFVIESLRTFSCRNGRNKRQRLKLSGFNPLDYDLVRIRLPVPDTLELIPHRRSAVQRHTLDAEALRIPSDSGPKEFFVALDAAFARGTRRLPHD